MTCGYMLLNSFQIMRTLPNRYESSLGKSRDGHHAGTEQAKTVQSRAPVLACFRVDVPTYVVTDAFPVGLGAILLQNQSTGERKPIAFISRSLVFGQSNAHTIFYLV